MPVFEPDDFGISPEWDGDDVRITHFEVADEYRGEYIASAILETLKRVYYYEGANTLSVRMGGGDAAAAFLNANDFDITETEAIDIDEDDVGGIEGGEIVTGVYEY